MGGGCEGKRSCEGASEQAWPHITVNGILIAPEAIGRELPHHPAGSREQAIFLASQALVIRELLNRRVKALDLMVTREAGENEEEAATRALIEREVPLPQADDAAGQHYFEHNRERFTNAPLLMVRHILLACPPDDTEERSRVREQADALLEQIKADGSRFTRLAMIYSACPSKEQGGALGQISKGQTVPEFERQLLRLPAGLALQPLESRYGFHLVWVDRRIDGQRLPYEVVAGTIRAELNQRRWQVAVVQYLKGLISAADIQGIVLEGADSPLRQ